VVAIPFTHFRGVATLVLDNCRDQLGSTAIVRTVAGQRANRIRSPRWGLQRLQKKCAPRAPYGTLSRS
jgi:hypothetical protein